MDKHDIETLYQQYAKPVYYYILNLSHDSDCADELTAETFYQVIKSIGKYDGSCNIQTWILSIAKHIWYQEIRKRKRLSGIVDNFAVTEDEPERIEEKYEKNDEKLSLYKRMQILDSETREVIYLRLSGELSYRQIGEVLGKSENWARVTFYRGKEKLKNNGKQ